VSSSCLQRNREILSSDFKRDAFASLCIAARLTKVSQMQQTTDSFRAAGTLRKFWIPRNLLSRDGLLYVSRNRAIEALNISASKQPLERRAYYTHEIII